MNVGTILITLEIWSGLLGINGLYSQAPQAEAGFGMQDNSYTNTFGLLSNLSKVNQIMLLNASLAAGKIGNLECSKHTPHFVRL